MKNFLRNSLAKKLILFAFVIGLVSPSAMAYKDGGFPPGTSSFDEGNLVAAVAPSIQNLNVTATNGSAQVSFDLNTASTVTVWIKDSRDNIVKTLVFDNNLSGGQTYSYTWNGTSNSGATVSSGSYKAEVVAYNATSSDIKNYVFNFTADSPSPAITAPEVSVWVNPSSFKPSLGEYVTINYTLNKEANLSVQVKKNGTVLKTLRNETNQQAGSYQLIWNGRDSNNELVSSGDYTIEVRGSNTAGSDTKNASVKVEEEGGPSVTVPEVNVSVSPNSFNPSSGENVVINYTINKEATVNVAVKKGGNLVKTLRNDVQQMGGSYQLLWDGRNGSGEIVSPGEYSIEVSAKNSAGIAKKSAVVNVQSGGGNVENAPKLSNLQVNPSIFDPHKGESTKIQFNLDKNAKVTVQIMDANGVVRTLDDEKSLSAGTYHYEWAGIGGNGQIVADKIYMVSVKASNSHGNDTKITTVEVKTTGGSDPQTCDLIKNHYVDPTVFNPKNRNAQISYNLSRNASVGVRIKKGSRIVKTIILNQTQSSGQNYVSWDGREADGDYAENGLYTYEIKAHVSGCNEDVKIGSVSVDKDGENDNDYEDDWPSTDENLIRDVFVRNEIFNPRNGERSTIEFKLTRRADLKVEVLDGRKVVKVLRKAKDQAAGEYSYTWDGRDSKGNIMRDALYTYRIMANDGNYTDTDRAYVEVDTDGIIIGFPESERCAGFRDVSIYSPFCKAIRLMSDRGIFEGYSDGTFRPYASINRAETVKVVTLALGYTVNTGGTYRNNYTDTSDSAWYAPYLHVAKREGIATGYPDGSFRPSSTINRVELLRVFLEGNKTGLYTCGHQPFNDTPITPDTHWYMKYACYAKDHGLMGSNHSNNLYPAAAMTRGDVADLFYDFEVKNLYSDFVKSRMYNTKYTSNNSNNNYSCIRYNSNGECVEYRTSSSYYRNNPYDRYYEENRYRYNYDNENRDGYYIYRDGRYIWMPY